MHETPVDYETFEELHTLLTLSFEGRIEPDQAARLEQLTASDPALQRLYLQMVRDALNLRTWAAFAPEAVEEPTVATPITSESAAACLSAASVPAASSPTRPRVLPRLALPEIWGRRMHPAQFLMWVVALTALGWIGLAGVLRPPNKMPTTTAEVDDSARPNTIVARLSSHLGARWGAAASQPVVGGALRAGQVLDLRTGVIEIAYDSGLRMVLQGPARFTIVSAELGHLHSGRLAALVPAQAVGFTIETPVARVIDLGTEFGVAVDPQGATEVHVFYGQVELAALAADSASPRVIVNAGETRHVAVGAEQSISVESSPTSYIRPQMLLAQQRRALDEQYQRWQAASLTLCKDPDLMVYFAFSAASRQAGRLLNEAEATAGRHDGLFGDGRLGSEPTWTEGRFPGKPGLEFDAVRDTCVVIPHHEELQPNPELTLALWFLPDQPQSTYHLVNKAVAPQVAYNLAVAGDTTSAAGALYFDWGQGGRVAPAVMPTQSRWTHVAITISAARQAAYYIDGSPVFQNPVAARGNCAGDVYVGAASWAPHVAFHGVIDELALFRRALSPVEITNLYQAGQPTPRDADKP